MVYHIGGSALTRLAAFGLLSSMRRAVRGKKSSREIDCATCFYRLGRACLTAVRLSNWDNVGSNGVWPRYNCKYPLPGLVPGIHALAAEIAKAQEDVDGRAKPGQGDLWLRMDRWRQPVSLNRTALGLTRPSLRLGELVV
jgi:hypothetical protein